MKCKEKRYRKLSNRKKRYIKLLKKIGFGLFTYIIPIILIAFPFGIAAYNFKDIYNNAKVIEISKYIIVAGILTCLEYFNILVSKMWIIFAIIQTDKWR